MPGAPAQTPQTVSALVVVYRTSAELAAVVASLRAQDRPPDEIIVVDNGSPDGGPISDSVQLGDLVVAVPSENLGFGAGCNLAYRQSSGDMLLFLNADVVLTTTAVSTMMRRLAADERAAVVGPRIYSGGRLQHSARAFPKLRTGLLGRRSWLTGLLHRANRLPSELRPAFGGAARVDWVSGACMLVRREAFEEVGGFDEGYWMYWEDADLCRRLAHRDWRVYFEPEAVVHHATGASGTSERTIRAFHESAARLADRHVVTRPAQRALARRMLRARAATIIWLLRWTKRLP